MIPQVSMLRKKNNIENNKDGASATSQRISLMLKLQVNLLDLTKIKENLTISTRDIKCLIN